MRPPQIDLASILAQHNPQIDLRLNAYDTSTRHFLKSVTSFKNRAITIITDRRNNQAGEMKRVAEKTQSIENETKLCKVKEIEILKEIQKEEEERKDAEMAVSAFRRQLASLKEQCGAVDLDIEQYRVTMTNLRQEKNKERWTLTSRAARASAELLSCENPLRCVVEGIEKDQLLVRFSHIDRFDLGREFSLVLDVSNRLYKVLTTTPVLPHLPILVDELNGSRDVYSFIRKVRIAFQDVVQRN